MRSPLLLTANTAVVLAAAAAALLFLRHAYGVLLFPYELAAGEELLLGDALHILRGQPLYTDVNDFPFVVSNYPPLFAALSAPFASLLGPTLEATRLVATLSTLLSACLIGAIIYQHSRAKMPAAICAGAFLGSIFVHEWGAWGRVDSTAILFSLLALLLIQDWPSRRGLLLATLCCLLSLYTKQTQWAAPMAILVWLLCRGERRRALRFALLLGGVGGLIFLIVNTITAGQFFRHLVLYNALPFSLRAFASYWRVFLVTHAALLCLALVYTALSARRRSLSLPVLFLVCAALLTVAVGRAGASSNYFLELIAACLILCGLVWSELSKDGRLAPAVVPVALLAQLLWFGLFPATPLAVYYDPLPSFGYTPSSQDAQSCARVDEYVRQSRGEILSEGGGFALKNGKELYGSPWLLNALEETGRVDTGLVRLEDALSAHRFSLVLLTWQSYPPRILETVWANYERVDTVDCVFTYEVFVPRETS